MHGWAVVLGSVAVGLKIAAEDLQRSAEKYALQLTPGKGGVLLGSSQERFTVQNEIGNYWILRPLPYFGTSFGL